MHIVQGPGRLQPKAACHVHYMFYHLSRTHYRSITSQRITGQNHALGLTVEANWVVVVHIELRLDRHPLPLSDHPASHTPIQTHLLNPSLCLDFLSDIPILYPRQYLQSTL